MSNSTSNHNQQQTEEWRDIPGTNGVYRISSFGNGFDVAKNKPLSPTLRGKYHTFRLRKWSGSSAVHRLVALAFLGECPERWVVNHKDLNKLNNRLDNLEYCTQSDNVRHAYANGAFPDKLPFWENPRIIKEMCTRRSIGVSYADIAASYNVDKLKVREVILKHYDNVIDKNQIEELGFDEPIFDEYYGFVQSKKHGLIAIPESMIFR